MRSGNKSKPSPSKPSNANITRYSIFAVIALAAIAAVVFLTRDAKRNTAANSTDNASTGLAAPMRTEFLKEGMLSFYTPDGIYVSTIDIELAENTDERRIGLMFRNTMGENQGMFFIFPYDDMQAFWMKNTILPLDMLFINSKDEIVTIHKNTTPFAETSYPSTSPAQYVLELNAGYVDKLGITEGYRISWMRTN